MRLRRARACGGQAMVEYTLLCAMLALALGLGVDVRHSLPWQWLHALHLFFQRFSFALSLPT